MRRPFKILSVFAMSFVLSGCTPHDVLRSYFSDNIVAFAKGQGSDSDATAWKDQGVPYDEYRYYKDHHLAVADYMDLRDGGLKDDQIHQWCDHRYTPDLMRQFADAGIHSPRELKMWVEKLGLPQSAFVGASASSDREVQVLNAPDVSAIQILLRAVNSKEVAADDVREVNLAYPSDWQDTDKTIGTASLMAEKGLDVSEARAKYSDETEKKKWEDEEEEWGKETLRKCHGVPVILVEKNLEDPIALEGHCYVFPQVLPDRWDMVLKEINPKSAVLVPKKFMRPETSPVFLHGDVNLQFYRTMLVFGEKSKFYENSSGLRRLGANFEVMAYY
ncbi:hypothetical protein FAI40_01205 [Acetobacteraceae bacterium]|nr:hypothetical protein FAI40_01205 [Acetobacteraceae bacterium]